MSIAFPSLELFEALKNGLEEDPSCSEGVAPSDAYCGFAIDDRLVVFEFEGRSCAAVVSGGNELDLDFILAGPASVWQRALEALDGRDGDTLGDLVKEGALEIRSFQDDGPPLAQAALPLLQVFLGRARGLDLRFV